MLNVSKDTINAYSQDGVHKELIIKFPSLGVTITNNQIEKESFNLIEKILSGDDLEFVGCIISSAKVTIHDDNHRLKGTKMTVSIKAENTDEIPLFIGYVDSISTELESTKKVITAYDELYTKASDKDVAYWYNTLTFPISIKELRDSLFKYIGIDQVNTTLPNDDVVVDKKYNPQELKAMDVIKNICQLNGMFGIINRYGVFEYRIPQKYVGGVFPSFDLYPDNDVFPKPPAADGNINLSYYEKLYFEEFDVNKITKVTVRDDNTVAGYSAGSGTNRYIIENNIFAYELDESASTRIAQKVLDNIEYVSYTPFEATVTGTPYVEVGDYVTMHVYDSRTGRTETKIFTIMSRRLSGLQHLVDTYEAGGIENQKVFISNLNTNLDALKKEIKDLKDSIYDKDDIDDKFKDVYDKIDEGVPVTEFKIRSVQELPATIESNVLYLIQGEVFTVEDYKYD